MKMVEYLCVGFVVKPQGIKGEAKVLPLTDDITRFNDLNKVYLYVENGYHELSIERARYTKDFVYLSLLDITIGTKWKDFVMKNFGFLEKCQ
jgi:16S rRNA processing protein RimM